MTTPYDTPVSPGKWRLALLALALTILIGAGTAVALLLGAADPPRAATLVLNLHVADDLAPAGTFGDVRLFALPVDLAPPFMIEMEASHSGDPNSAWGLWLRVGDPKGTATDYPMLIDYHGYVLAALTTPALQHQEFMHLEPGSNRLSVYFDGSRATFRVNDEIFAALDFPAGTITAGGLALDGDPRLSWESIKIYTGG